MSTSRYLLRSLVPFCLTFLSAALASQHGSAPPRNVLFIMADDLRVELASYGSPAITPNLNRLAARAIQFNNAYCQQSVCNPSRASLLSGLRPDQTRIWDNRTHIRETLPDVVTLPEYFKAHGYETRGVGKIFHNWHENWAHGDPQSWTAPAYMHFAHHGNDLPMVQGALPPNEAPDGPRMYYQTTPLCECRDVPDQAYYDGRVADEAVRQLNEIKGRPFFLAVGFWKPHAPFNAPKRYWDMYDPSKIQLHNTPKPSGAPDIAFHDSREILGLPGQQVVLSPDQEREIRHGYLANISYMDAQLGKVLDALDASGVAGRTIIVFLSDNGYHLGEHSLWSKTSNFELDTHVPLYIAEPGNPNSGQRTKSIVELVDLFPTLVALCKLPEKPDLAGTDLSPILTNPGEAAASVAYSQHPRPAFYGKRATVMGYSIRTSKVRYAEWRDWTDGNVIARELYSADDEPAETRNRIDDPQLVSEQRYAASMLLNQFPQTPHP